MVLGQIQAHGRGGDDLEVERLEHDAGGPGNARQARAHDVERVFGGEEQHAPGPGGPKPPQTRRAGGDGDGHVEGEKRLAALGLAADDADGLGRPEVFDQPAVLRGLDRRGRARVAPAAGVIGAASAGSRRPLAGAADAGRGEDLEIELFVELRQLALGGDGEEVAGHGGEHAVIAEGVLAERGHELGGHEAGVAGGVEQMRQAGAQLLPTGVLQGQAAADAAAEGPQVLAPEEVGQAAVAGQHDAEQGARVEVRAGQQPQLAEDQRRHLLGLVDQEHGAEQRVSRCASPPLAQGS